MNETKASSMPPSDCPQQLDWSAFLYAASEMSAAEAEQFEARLADDQAAREALARAVEFTQIVAAAESQAASCAALPRHRGVGWETRLSWMAIGGLASVVIALLSSGVLQSPLAGPSEKQLALASAWTQARADLALLKDDGLWPASAASAGEAEEDLLAMSDAADDSPLGATPSWMTAAVRGLSSEEPRPEPFTNERGEN